MNQKTKMIIGTALFTAIVFVLQHIAKFIKFGPFSITLVLAPIIIGAAIYGIGTGIWLGLEFGLLVLLPLPIGTNDAALFFAVNPLGTIVTVLLKGALMGFAAGLIYKALEKKNSLVATICAGITAPVVNTGIFLLGCLVFFMPTVNEWAKAAGMESAGKFMIFGLVGVNFLVELGINLVLATVIVRIIKIGKKETK